ncbi:PQQ-binding-like beta-propeller repeat protein [Streptomyces sp. CAI-121]|uniref:outer membrane protein assembly factor BamB family protein n=1 Tax=unclassified Streptomyces TaxID=2593676 RepID=UPI001587E7B6|nr:MULTISPECIES: PQQ-binding-like beta-propeller repeat protein [unclassified Streptomyces]NUV66730.1 PQQ-binding-like beta-propeller repeat protein [Streptomyces sp. CAI-121]NUW11588.1 PQQ-binding-like beta-propeller repeat protein [Streptomyces sp. CAI-68]
MPDPQQPWYTPGPPQQPVPGNPYASGGGAQQGFGAQGFGAPAPPPPPPPRRRFGRGPVVAAVVALVLVVVAGGVYGLTDWGRDEPAKPVAKESPGPSGSASPSRTPGAGGPELSHIPTTKEVAAARKPGEASAWIADDKADIPKQINKVHDLWIVGDTAVQALYRKVTAYRLSDGAEVWSATLPSAVCETPANPTPDGKVVVFRNERPDNERSNACNQMQMIDLKTGKLGWQKKLDEPGDGDAFIVYSAISGDVLSVARGMVAITYRMADGSKLYEIPRENKGKCVPDDVAGGPARLLVSSECMIAVERGKNYGQVRELDPHTGKVLWRYRMKTGWRFGSLISMDPVVFTIYNDKDTANDWRITVLDPKGKHRVTFDARDKGFEHCAGDGGGDDIQPCRGASVDKGLIMLGGQDRAGAYDVKTGKFLWGIKSETMPLLYPLRAEDGKSMRIYEAATSRTPGRTYLMGPRGAGTETEVVKHPAATARWEYEMFMGHTAYVDGRLVLTATQMSGDENKKPVREARMLSFAASP